MHTDERRWKIGGPLRKARAVPFYTALLAMPVLAADRPFLEIDPDSVVAFRERGSGRAFVAVGVNYFDPHVGWAPKLWKQFDATRDRANLARVREQGFNTIRVFLTWDSFHREPGVVHPDGLAKFRKLLGVCGELGLYVIPSGPDHWEGTPAWRGDQFADEATLRADDAWWKAFAAAVRDEPTILAWDLYNEPAIAWNSPVMKERWNAWLRSEYGSIERIVAAWGRPANEIGELGAIAPAPAEPKRNDPRLYDYQRFRESVAEAWTRRRVEAIRAADKNHMITVGYHPFSVPVYVPAPAQYCAFDVVAGAKRLDFVTVHFYPIDHPMPNHGPEGFPVNAAYLEASLRYCSVGKPVMLGEFGWYGGGEVRVNDKVEYAAQPQEHQLAWCRQVLEISRGRLCGWLNWAYADTPRAMDISMWSGCWTSDHRLKPWGEAFGRFAREVTTTRPAAIRAWPAYYEALPLDRKALLTDPQAGKEYREAVRKHREAP